MAQTPVQDHQALVGSTVYDGDGEEVGEVAGVYLDTRTGEPEWAAVRMEHGELAFVPLTGAAMAGGEIDVSLGRDQIVRAGDASTVLSRRQWEKD